MNEQKNRTPVVVAMIGAGVVLLMLFSYVAIVRGASADLDHQIALARGEGVALAPADLRTQIDESKNAAPFVERAIALASGSLNKPFSDFSKALTETDEPKPLADQSAADPFIPPLQPIIALYRQASAYPYLDFHRKWEQGPSLLFPEYSYLKGGVKLLVADADLKVRTGHVADAFDELRDAAHISSLTGQDPTLIGLLVSIAQQQLVQAELERIMWRLGPQSGMAEHVSAVINAMGPIEDLRHGLRGEPVMSQMALNMLADGQLKPSDFGPEGGMPPALALAKFKSGRDAFDARAVEFWRSLFASLPVDPNNVSAAMSAMKQADDRLNSQQGWQYTFIKVVGPVFSGAGSAIASELAQRRALQNCADLLTIRVHDPKALSIPEDGLNGQDPFTGRPLMIVTRPKGGFAIYSVGPDLKDDGGLRRNTDHISDAYDVVAEYPRPSAAARK